MKSADENGGGGPAGALKERRRRWMLTDRLIDVVSGVLFLLLIVLALLLTFSVDAQDATFQDYVRFGSGVSDFIQTTQIYAPEWETIAAEPEAGEGSVLCVEGVTGSFNDGCYIIRIVLYNPESDRWLAVLETPVPFWTEFYYLVEFRWSSAQVFADGFESGDTASWSTVVGE